MGQRPLMFGAASGNASRDDLSTLGYKIPQGFRLFIIDCQLAVGAETAYFAAMVYSSFSKSTFGPGFKSCHFMMPPLFQMQEQLGIGHLRVERLQLLPNKIQWLPTNQWAAML